MLDMARDTVVFMAVFAFVTWLFLLRDRVQFFHGHVILHNRVLGHVCFYKSRDLAKVICHVTHNQVRI